MGGMIADTCTVTLPTTGSDVGSLLLLAVALVVIGATVLVWRRRSRAALAGSAMVLLAVLTCFGAATPTRASALDCVGAATAATTTTLVASSPGIVTTTTVASGSSTSTSASSTSSTTSTTAVASSPVPPVAVAEVPVPALFGLSGALMFFAWSLFARRRRLVPIPVDTRRG